jgi:hypothetical protein
MVHISRKLSRQCGLVAGVFLKAAVPALPLVSAGFPFRECRPRAKDWLKRLPGFALRLVIARGGRALRRSSRIRSLVGFVSLSGFWDRSSNDPATFSSSLAKRR